MICSRNVRPLNIKRCLHEILSDQINLVPAAVRVDVSSLNVDSSRPRLFQRVRCQQPFHGASLHNGWNVSLGVAVFRLDKDRPWSRSCSRMTHEARSCSLHLHWEGSYKGPPPYLLRCSAAAHLFVPRGRGWSCCYPRSFLCSVS